MIKEVTFSSFYKSCRDKMDAVLFDVDGTLSAAGKALPGAAELIELLERDRFPYLLLTNDSCNSCEQKAQILHQAGLPVPLEKILSAGDVLASWATADNYKGELYFQCGVLGDPPFAAKAHMNVTTDVSEIDRCYGVVMGEGQFDWQQALEAVFNFFLKKPDAPLIVTNPDSYWPSCRGSGMGIGAGGLARFICATLHDAGVKVTPVCLGKPYAPIYQCAREKLMKLFPGVALNTPGRIAFVGDSLASDIRGANANGLFSCLVLTGITGREMAEKATVERRPAAIFEAV